MSAPDSNDVSSVLPSLGRTPQSDVRNLESSHGSFDREKLILYWTAALLLASVWAAYFLGYVLPAQAYGRAVVNAYQGSPSLTSGCYLHFLEHSNLLQMSTSIRFVPMIVGTAVTFVGAMFTIKGLEAPAPPPPVERPSPPPAMSEFAAPVAAAAPAHPPNVGPAPPPPAEHAWLDHAPLRPARAEFAAPTAVQPKQTPPTQTSRP